MTHLRRPLNAAAIALFSAALTAAAPTPAAPPAEQHAGTAFARLKSLAGTWRNAERPDSPLSIRFELTAGGTVLAERWLRGDAPHSLTLYHLDGDRLIATHYCPQGNQPRLVLRPGTLGFIFLDATGLDPNESHLHTLAFDLTDPQRPVRSEVYRSGAEEEPSRLVLVRE